MTQASPLSRLEKLADANYGPIPKEEFFGGDFSQHEAFMAGGKAFLQILSEPGEDCGPRAILGKVDYCDLRELLQARAAHSVEVNRLNYELDKSRASHCAALASSEARVRILYTALMRISDTREHPGSKRIAEEALLEVQR